MSKKSTPSSTILDPLLTEDDSRYVMFPLKDHDIWQMYKKQVDCFWRAEEIDLSKDGVHWQTLEDDERYFISMIFSTVKIARFTVSRDFLVIFCMN